MVRRRWLTEREFKLAILSNPIFISVQNMNYIFRVQCDYALSVNINAWHWGRPNSIKLHFHITSKYALYSPITMQIWNIIEARTGCDLYYYNLCLFLYISSLGCVRNPVYINNMPYMRKKIFCTNTMLTLGQSIILPTCVTLTTKQLHGLHDEELLSLASYQIRKIAGCDAPGMLGKFSTAADFKVNR